MLLHVFFAYKRDKHNRYRAVNIRDWRRRRRLSLFIADADACDIREHDVATCVSGHFTSADQRASPMAAR